MEKELSKRIKELATVGECLIPLQLIWFIVFWTDSMIPVLACKGITALVALGMAIGCNKQKEYGIKCAHILAWIELIVSAEVLIFWLAQKVIYIFGFANIIFCIALYYDLAKIEKLKKNKNQEVK